jgi:6-pyruvoyltetrahydropterin/6-carboxytetrahydropterin synthase
VIRLTRRYRFPAAHVLRRPDWSEAQNARVYGKCAHPGGHGHDYGIEVTVAGPLDPTSGHVLAPETLDALVRERVLERFSHRLLNDDPLFASAVPTAENLALAIQRELAAPVTRTGTARLSNVRVVETPRNTFDAGAPR